MSDLLDDDRAARLAEVQDDLSRRWAAGERVSVESYLVSHPWLRDDSAATLALIYHEILLRRDLGDSPRLEEFSERFPQHTEALRRMFAIHAVIDEAPPLSSSSALSSAAAPTGDTTRIQVIPAEASTAQGRCGPDGTRISSGERGDTPRPLPAPEGYEILAEIGRGGMGVVFRARQVNLNRLVALKMILSGPYADGAALARFRAEAEAVARLQHPHIVQIFEMGELDGRPFFAMEYVAGESLAARTRATPQPPREVALLVERLARAIHAVHEQGIVHRDLKPANVLLAGSDVPLGQAVPKIVDFGLAKFVDLDSPSATISRDVLGTPLYMAPEQAAGQSKDAGPAVDIYALGAMLYVLLTGQPPFKGATLLDILTQIKSSDPVPPRRLLPQIPRDLETICLKCLQKEPRKRYASAAALADDLRRFSAGEPILARPTAWWERCLKWARREPRVAALVAAISAVTLIGLVTTATLWRLADRRADAEAEQRQRVEQQLYFFRIGLADRELQAGRVPWAREQLELCPPSLRRWELHYLMRQCEGGDAVKVCSGHSGKLSSVAFSPDGKHVATGSSDRSVRIWDAATAEFIRQLNGHVGSVNSVSFSAQGDRLVSGSEDGRVVVWNASTWEKEFVFDQHASPVSSAVFDPQSDEVASGTFNSSGPGEILIWDSRIGEVRLTLKGHGQRITGLAYSPDGKLLFSSSHDQTVRVWDTANGETVRVFAEHVLPVSGLAVSSDGQLVASAAGRSQADQPDEGDILVWEAHTGRIVHRLQGHRERALALAFGPDGQRLATAGWDPEIKLWDMLSGQEVLALRGHAVGDARGVMGLAFSPRGDSLASAGVDMTARIWSGAGLESAGANSER